MLSFFTNRAKTILFMEINNDSNCYLIGPVVVDDFQYVVGGGENSFLIADTNIPRYSYDQLLAESYLLLSLIHRYYRSKKIKSRLLHPSIVTVTLKRNSYAKLSANGAHVSYAFEKETNLAVLNGDVAHIKSAMESLYSSGRIGILSDQSKLRNIIDFGIIAVSTNIRVALRHGMDFELAYSLNDHYVFLLETQKTINDVLYCIERELIDLSRQIQKHRQMRMPPSIERAYHELLTNVKRNIKLDEMAATLNMSPNYFSSLFKQWIGLSFSQFRVLAKINYSLTLLTATDKPISEIADELGFSDQAYFSNMFKQFTNTTPGRFRQDTMLLKDWSIYQFLK